MRLLCISIEFSAGTFSGNGIYCRSQVRALSRLGHEVLVICGAPQAHSEPRQLEGAADLLEVELPVWGRLDGGCSWQEFAAGAASARITRAVAAFAPEAVLGVDWHSLAAYEGLAGALAALGHQLAPYVFMNYRVYLRTATGPDAELLSALERRALAASACTTVLSRSDAQFLHEAFPDVAPSKALHVLLPALRSDMERLPMPADVAQHAEQPGEAPCSGAGCASAVAERSGAPGASSSSNGAGGGQPDAPSSPAAAGAATTTVASRPAVPAALQGLVDPGRGRYLLTCAVRLSPEKEPHRFVDVAVELSRRGALARCGATPLMLGAGWGSEYGAALRQRVERELPECIILDSFMGPAELAAVYSATLLNVHPCCYDAYGMTIVEAASQGTPSLVNEGGHVGATDLLDESSGEVICVDLSRPAAELATEVEALLGDRRALGAVGAAAARKARSWSEEANAAELVRLVRAALEDLGKSNSSGGGGGAE